METPHLAINKGRACVRLIEAADVLLATGDLTSGFSCRRIGAELKARLLVAGAIVGAVLAVGLWLVWAGSNARTASITLRVIDEATGPPVTGTVTIRRETLDGKLIGAEDGETYTGQTITIEAPVDPNAYLWVLVEADGYHDWEMKFRIKTEGTADGPVRLKHIEPASPNENG